MNGVLHACTGTSPKRYQPLSGLELAAQPAPFIKRPDDGNWARTCGNVPTKKPTAKLNMLRVCLVPKRIIDGEAMWASEKIRALPAWAKAEFAWLLPLAMANGVFECDFRRIWATCYAYGRPEMSMEQLVEVFHSFSAVGLLFRWRESDGKEWGHWVGISKIGRLPPQSRIYRKHETCGPEPPKKLLLEFMASHWPANGLIGLGLGLSSQDHMFCSKSSSETAHKKNGHGNGTASVDDLKKNFLLKCEDPDGILSKTIDVIIERAETSGVKINSERYLETAIEKFNFESGKDREELMQRISKKPPL